MAGESLNQFLYGPWFQNCAFFFFTFTNCYCYTYVVISVAFNMHRVKWISAEMFKCVTIHYTHGHTYNKTIKCWTKPFSLVKTVEYTRIWVCTKQNIELLEMVFVSLCFAVTFVDKEKNSIFEPHFYFLKRYAYTMCDSYFRWNFIAYFWSCMCALEYVWDVSVCILLIVFDSFLLKFSFNAIKRKQ